MHSYDILSLEKYLVDNKYGIIKNVMEIESPNGFPNIYRVRAHKENLKSFQESCNDGFGYNFSKEQARRSAIGEAIERYCSAYIPKNLLKSSYNEISSKGNAINPNAFIQKKYEYGIVSAEEEIYWSEAIDVLSNKKYYVPASVIYLPLQTDKCFPCLRSQNSTGLATGISLENAIISGIYECVERDAFAIMWYNKLYGRIVSTSIMDRTNRKIIETFSKLGLKIIVKQINTDINIPVYFSILINESDKKLPRMYVNSKCGTDLNMTIYNMLGELIGGYYSLLELKDLYDIRIPRKLKDIKTLEDHALYYGYNETNVDFLSEGKEFITQRERNENLGHNMEGLKKTLKNSGIDIYYSDITTKEIEQLGLKVVRVFSTNLCFLEKDYELYINTRINMNGKRNEIPHPFS